MIINFPYPNPTKQQVFDRVLSFLRKQNKPSISESDSDTGSSPYCAYRGVGKTACAVGCLISDYDYKEEMEGMAVYILRESGYLQGSLRWMSEESMIGLLDSLQCAHDAYLYNNTQDKWEIKMREVANNYGLVYRENKLVLDFTSLTSN